MLWLFCNYLNKKKKKIEKQKQNEFMRIIEFIKMKHEYVI